MENQTPSADRKVTSFAAYFEPVRKSITVRCAPERAFSMTRPQSASVCYEAK